MADILQFPTQDIPSIMRRVADLIETGEIDATTIIAISLNDDGAMDLFGWGKRTAPLEVAGILAEAGPHWWEMRRSYE